MATFLRQVPRVHGSTGAIGGLSACGRTRQYIRRGCYGCRVPLAACPPVLASGPVAPMPRRFGTALSMKSPILSATSRGGSLSRYLGEPARSCAVEGTSERDRRFQYWCRHGRMKTNRSRRDLPRVVEFVGCHWRLGRQCLPGEALAVPTHVGTSGTIAAFS